MATKLLPIEHDHDTGPFFAAAREHRLVVKVCDDCATTIHPPREFCFRCRSFNTSWHEASSTGTLFTWTVVEHPVHPGYPAPYTVVLVELDAPTGVRLVGSIDGRAELEIGMPMELWWDDRDEGVVLPNWRPAQP